jgi:hypothetical protein
MTAGHEGGFFFVPYLDELERMIRATEGGYDAVDAVTGIAEYTLHAPLPQAFEEEITDCFCHGHRPLMGKRSRTRLRCTTPLQW